MANANYWDKYESKAEPFSNDYWSKYEGSMRSQDNEPLDLKNIFGEVARSNFPLHAHEMVREESQGAKEGLMGALNAIQGKQYEASPEPEGEWAKMGRNIGKYAGRGAVAAPIGAALTASAGAAGIPLAGVLGAAGAGYATTEGDIPSRFLGALEYGVPVGAGKLAHGIFKTMPEQIAKGLLKGEKNQKELYKKGYGEIFSRAGKEPTKIPQMNHELIKKYDTGNYTKSLDRYLENPTLENAHKAQSDLGKLYNKHSKSSAIGGMSSEQIEAMNATKLAQKKIRGSMFSRLAGSGQQDIASQYGNLTKGYGEDVIPYSKSKALQDFKRGDISASTLAKKIGRSEKFMLRRGSEHPEIAQKAIIDKLLGMSGKALKIGAPIGFGAELGSEWIKHILSGNE